MTNWQEIDEVLRTVPREYLDEVSDVLGKIPCFITAQAVWNKARKSAPTLALNTTHTILNRMCRHGKAVRYPCITSTGRCYVYCRVEGIG